MNIDKFTTSIVVILLFTIVAFLTLNHGTLAYAIKSASLCIGPILTFLCIMGIIMSTLNFKGDKRLTIIIGTFSPIIFLLFVLIAHNSLLTCGLLNVNLQAPVEGFPFDFGLIGLAFILINGFLVSHIFIAKNINKTERFLLTIGLGFGITSFIMLLLGIIWEISVLTAILTQTTVLILTSIVTLHNGFKLNFKKLKSPLKGKGALISKSNLIEIIISAIISVHTVIATYQTIAYPAIEWDSLAYGVNYAKIIYENNKIPIIAGPSIGLEMSANYPPGVQILAVFLYLFAGTPNDFYYRIMQPIFGLAVMIATYKLAILTTKNRTASLFAVLILSVIPVFWDEFVLETYLMNLTLMLMLSTYFFLKAYNSFDSKKEKYEIVGTMFCAFSALTSYIGLFSLGILLLYAIYKKLRLKRLIWLMILASLILLPWYVRNFLLLGNPVYPIFGIGARLDPLLETSAVQHFQNWLKRPLFGLLSILCKFGVCILSLAIAYLTFVKRNIFIIALALYLLLISISIMAFHVPFMRYLLIPLPILSVVFSATIKSSISKQNLVEKSIAGIFILLILISNINVIPYLNITKPMYSADNKWSYLTQVYGDADAWKWINENTPIDAGIATYDIREYYIERKIMPLDGYEAAPIYKMNTIEEAINYLIEQNITYILSATWASPMDARMPPAYKWCILTRYLGDPRYLPPVYVGSKGTTVYHVGPIEEETLYKIFSQRNFIPPLKHLKINVTITNQTSPPSGEFNIPIPLDYREGLMILTANSCGHSVNIELWKNLELVKRWPPQSINDSDIENPSFVWEVDNAGYLTFLVLSKEPYEESFNVTLNIDFYNYWDKNPLFLDKGLKIYNVTLSMNTFPLMKTFYIQVNEPAVLSINSTTFGKRISLEICQDFVPNNAAINWSEQYYVIRQQPNVNETLGEINPSIRNMFLPFGKYSIIVVDRGDSIERGCILLEVKLTPLK